MIVFYDIFIYPLELFMTLVLEKVLSLTDSPLISLTVLSLVVTIVSLPIYHLAETWQDKERAIQKKLKPKLLEFKSVFKGASLNTYINTLYRQNSYHPIHAVRTSFGLLIQIPFFFAAFHLLSNYGEFDGLKTFIFDDLGKPDRLFSIGGLPINAMPFIMTIVNIASSFIYSKKTIGKEKIQLYGIAALFLIVLYNSSAALLYYWTFNNVFSLIKNYIYTKLYKDGFISNTKAQAPKKKSAFISSIYDLRPGFWTIFQLLSVVAVAFFLGFFYAPDKNSTEIPALILSLIPMLTISFFLLISNLTNRSGYKRALLSSLYGVSLLTSIVLSVIRISSASQNNFLLEVAVYFAFFAIAAESIIHFFIALDNSLVKLMPKENALIRSTFNRALFFLVFLIFITAPLTVLSSGSASDFDESIFHYANYLVGFSIVVFAFLKIIHSNLSAKWRSFVTTVILSLSLISLTNVFIFSGNYGDMSHFIFKDDIFNSDLFIFLNVLSGVFLLIVSFLLVARNKVKFINPILAIASFSLVVLSFIDTYSFLEKRETPPGKVTNSETHFTFSKTGKNVVVLMLDRFIGGYVPQALKFLPELKTEMDGFTWYPNTLSPASYTIGGVPAVMGGWDYYVKTVNSTRSKIPLMDKLDESARIMPYNFDKAGYKVDIYADVKRWFKKEDRKNLGKSEFHELDLKKIKNKWLDINKVNSRKDDNTVRKQLLVFGVFRAAPAFLRKWIYDEGTWHIEVKDNSTNKKSKKYVSFHQKSQWRRHTCLKYYAVMDFLPEFSKSDDDPKNRFLYLSNNLPHEPHSINMNFEYEPSGKVRYPKSIQKKFGKSTNALKHLYTDTATLRLVRDWLKWMKENDVYDNTRIILISDHGRDVFNPFFDKQKIKNTRKKAHPSYFNNLLMIKDFNEHGKLKTSDDFMTSLDVPTLAMKNIIEGTNPFTGGKIEIPEQKLPFTAFDTQWRNEKQGKYEFKYHEKYEISEDISKIKNWKIIKEK